MALNSQYMMLMDSVGWKFGQDTGNDFPLLHSVWVLGWEDLKTEDDPKVGT